MLKAIFLLVLILVAVFAVLAAIDPRLANDLVNGLVWLITLGQYHPGPGQ